MNDIMYKYALTQNKELTDIENLTKINIQNNEYNCISCGEKLIPKLGNIRAHHFAHYESNVCSKETYLHKLGKMVFYENYIECIDNNFEYNIEYEFTKECNYFSKKYNKICSYKEDQKFNLIEYFPNIKYQKKDGNFIPDLLLIDKNNKNKIFIEIFVTHRVSDEKINSENRIIEIKIKEEKDIELIKQNILSYKDERINFYNIQKTNVKDNCKGQCKKLFRIIYFDNRGEINFSNFTLSEIENDSILEYYILNDHDEYNNDLIKIFAAKCSKKNLPVKNCNLCRYHMLDKFKQNKEEPIFCKFLNFICDSMEAENCDSYVQDYKIIDRIKMG
jgi:hypothetical protein